MIYGFGGEDRLFGGTGTDWIIGGYGADLVEAGPGVDVIYAGDGRRDVIDCGSGFDCVRYDYRDVLYNCEVGF